MVAGAVGVASMVLGGGRERAEDGIDHAVGIVCRVKPGEAVRGGQTVYEVRYRSTTRMLDALPLLEESFTIADAPAPDHPLLLEELAMTLDPLIAAAIEARDEGVRPLLALSSRRRDRDRRRHDHPRLQR